MKLKTVFLVEQLQDLSNKGFTSDQLREHIITTIAKEIGEDARGICFYIRAIDPTRSNRNIFSFLAQRILVAD